MAVGVFWFVGCDDSNCTFYGLFFQKEKVVLNDDTDRKNIIII